MSVGMTRLCRGCVSEEGWRVCVRGGVGEGV